MSEAVTTVISICHVRPPPSHSSLYRARNFRGATLLPQGCGCRNRIHCSTPFERIVPDVLPQPAHLRTHQVSGFTPVQRTTAANLHVLNKALNFEPSWPASRHSAGELEPLPVREPANSSMRSITKRTKIVLTLRNLSCRTVQDRAARVERGLARLAWTPGSG